jgi:hypothetical protein
MNFVASWFPYDKITSDNLISVLHLFYLFFKQLREESRRLALAAKREKRKEKRRKKKEEQRRKLEEIEAKNKENFELQAAQEKEKLKVEGIFSKQVFSLLHIIRSRQNCFHLNQSFNIEILLSH